MELPEDERIYLQKIYRHGLNHLVEDTIPNKLMCVHSVHWVLERLIRIVSADYNDSLYRDGFEKTFRKFANRHNEVLSPNLKLAVEKFNTMRNDIEHRGIPPDFTFLNEILRKIFEFIKWLMRYRFENADFDPYKIPVVEERQIFLKFEEWKEKRCPISDYANPKEWNTFDSLYMCIIPSSYSENLVNFSADSINDMVSNTSPTGVTMAAPNPQYHSEIEKYFRNYNVLHRSQVYCIPKFLKEYRESRKDELELHPTGSIFIRLNYATLFRQQGRLPEKYKKLFVFAPEKLFNIEKKTSLITHGKFFEKYGTEIEECKQDCLEDILKVILFPFLPECKISMVRLRTKYFTIKFIFPMMILGQNESRYLYWDDNKIFSNMNRKYLGEDADLIWTCTFSYEEITQIVQKLKVYCYDFFKNEADTGFE